MTHTVFVVQESSDGVNWYDDTRHHTPQDGQIELTDRVDENATFVAKIQARQYRLVRRETTEEVLPTESIPTQSAT
jgi:hypothetical protein